ncbi:MULTISPECIES: response regulator transcription factor [Paraclostridium]|uniref:Stage 0 sporulation protein A homolog n=1 Tax=Paraclostridium bifermentans TaxID=1490 RepID=A0A5P3XC60_PARBF|nr:MULTISPECIES: response regulator transcription factor [Paraclostridium]MDV8110577.1 response regulator transcription factor [Bacillus sp. BAU-SS-2023]MBZ6004794.1 response regulator transcription factor [Paraclostridium bifermentans]MDU0298211.1 response regulator transcription factor [Paraclostridium sp. MRS3W1]QEZ68262.1 DNA-binding response regulator [Paraclostridium bifermentans]TQO57910.1 DNA-binding response regulator [Paraclostridium bifermentans]
MVNILVADDDLRILRLINDFLKLEEFNVYKAENGKEAIELFEKENISLAILDIMMPIVDGWDVCKHIKSKSDIPVLILTAKDSDIDELFGFDIGADEYMSKPFNPQLLIARVKNLLKRFNSLKENQIFKYEDIILQLNNNVIKIEEIEVELTPIEYELMFIFLNNVGISLKKDKLLDLVWGYDYYGDPRTLDTHITRLRKKLGYKSELIKNIRGFGYVFGR